MSLLNLFPFNNVTVADNAPATIDVLAGDLFYPFLSLYSLNQSNPFYVTTTATTKLGATISITSGKVLYDPTTSSKIQSLSAGETLTDTFFYEERNFLGLITLQTETVTVTGVNHAPVFSAPTTSIVLSKMAGTGSSALDSASVAVGFTDVNLSDTHTISASLKSIAWSYGGSVSASVQAALAGALTTAISSDSKGTGSGSATEVFAAPDKTFDFLAAGQTLTANYLVTLSDNHGGSTTQTVTVTIKGPADTAPTALQSLVAINVGQLVKGSVGATDPDVGDTLTYSLVTGPTHGTFTLGTNGAYSYQPAGSYSGTDSFVFAATDKAGLKSTATVQIQVAAAGAQQVAYLPNLPSGAADQAVSTQLVVDTNQAAGLKGGGHVVVWSASLTTDPNANFDIYMQRFDAAGNPVGGNVQITTATSNQVHPSVAGLSNGSYVVVWESDNAGTGRVVYGQVFNATGTAVSSQFLIDTPVAGDRTFPSVAALQNGGFAVTWQGFDEVTRANADDVFSRTYDNSGTATSGVVTVNQVLLGDQQTYGDLVRTVAALTNGNYVATWTDLSGNNGAGDDVYARIMKPDGTALSNQFIVSTTTTGDQTNVTVGALSSGGFVTAWQDASLGIEAQIYTAAGAKVGTQLQVSSFNNGGQLYPAVSTLSDGSFVVIWQSFGDDGTNSVQVAGQRYTASGAAIGGEFIVNSSTTGSHELPSLALRSDGALIATWRDENTPATITEKIITNFNATIGPETLVGAAGPNVLYGNTGNDTIKGGASNDLLAGLGGADTLTGGGGADHFLYTAQSDSTLAAMDKITDFVTGLDKLDFVNALGLTTVSTADVTSTSSLGAHTVAWHFDGTNTTVFANVGAAAETISSGADIMAISLAGGKITGSDINLHA